MVLMTPLPLVFSLSDDDDDADDEALDVPSWLGVLSIMPFSSSSEEDSRKIVDGLVGK